MKRFNNLHTVIVTTPKFDVFDIEGEHSYITTLDKLYRKGWWITEVFGTEAFVVKRVGWHSFICLTCHFRSHCDGEILSFIEKFASKKYKKWRKYLLGIK